MKTLAIIVCCFLLLNWGWDYSFSHFVSDLFGMGVIIAIAAVIGIGLFLGTAAAVGTAIFVVAATVFYSLVSALWPILIIGLIIALCSSKKKHYSH